MTKAGVRLTTVQIAEARQLHDNDWSYMRIADRFGCNYKTVKLALDPEFAVHRRKQVNEARYNREVLGKRSRIARESATATSVKADGAARLAEIPKDTRSLTAILCGDPLPGRSSLDKARRI